MKDTLKLAASPGAIEAELGSIPKGDSSFQDRPT